MIVIRLLEGGDYFENFTGNDAFCLNFLAKECHQEMEAMKLESSTFYQNLHQTKRGGILVAEEVETGEIVGWFSFFDKETAQEIFWPCGRVNQTKERLVGGCLLVDSDFRGRGIGTTLVQELLELAQEWEYKGVEVACRAEDSTNPELTWHTTAPFIHAGFIEVERYQDDLKYPADFIIMEYAWA